MKDRFFKTKKVGEFSTDSIVSVLAAGNPWALSLMQPPLQNPTCLKKKYIQVPYSLIWESSEKRLRTEVEWVQD